MPLFRITQVIPEPAILWKKNPKYPLSTHIYTSTFGKI